MNTNNPAKQWAKDMNRHLAKEDLQRANNQMKIYPASFVIRKCNLKIQRNTTTHLLGWLKLKRLTIPNVGGGGEPLESPYWWECKMVQLLWKNLMVSLRFKQTCTMWSSYLICSCLPREIKAHVLQRFEHEWS